MHDLVGISPAALVSSEKTEQGNTMWRRSGYESNNVVEVYFDAIKKSEGNRPELEVRGKRFSRTIHRQAGLPDLIVQQTVEPELLYLHERCLSSRAMGSQSQLERAILEQPPVWTEPALQARMSTPEPDAINWERVAAYLSSHSYNSKSVSFLSRPFLLKGDQGFGREYIRREIRDWDGACFGNQRQPPPVEVINAASGFIDTGCVVCHQGFAPDGSDYDDLAGFICRHLFHRECIYRFMWREIARGNEIRCPGCNEATVA